LEILNFESLASTSSHTSERLKSGTPAPFAVVAREQTGGRGRRGRSWSSPLGGIYLSIAMPPPEMEIELIGNLSLWVGIEIGRWLQQHFGFKAALKWPNDVMFDGRKLGGILIESGIEGQKQGPIIIGIGLNCLMIPNNQLSPLEVHPIALSEICALELPLNTDDLAHSLIHHIENEWSKLGFADALKNAGKEFLDWSPPMTRLWIDKVKNEFWWIKDVLKDGSLSLNQCESGIEKIIHSVDHQMSVIKKTDQFPVVFADVGNTAIKIVCYKSLWHSEPFLNLQHVHAEGDVSALKAGLNQAFKQMPTLGWPLFIVGVAPKQNVALWNLASTIGFSPIDVGKYSIRLHGAYPLKQIGIDRLCLMEGWLCEKPKANDLAVIASFGTAVTIDLVKGSGLHLGGVIAPGLSLAAKALHEHTGLLPLVAVKEIVGKDLIGYTTSEAISSGVLAAAVGLVERMLRDVARREHVASKNIKLLLTGGDAELAKTYLPQATLAPGLLFQGLKSMVAGGLVIS